MAEILKEDKTKKVRGQRPERPTLLIDLNLDAVFGQNDFWPLCFRAVRIPKLNIICPENYKYFGDIENKLALINL